MSRPRPRALREPTDETRPRAHPGGVECSPKTYAGQARELEEAMVALGNKLLATPPGRPLVWALTKLAERQVRRQRT